MCCEKKRSRVKCALRKEITRKMCPQEKKSRAKCALRKKFTRKMCLFDFFAPAVKNALKLYVHVININIHIKVQGRVIVH